MPRLASRCGPEADWPLNTVLARALRSHPSGQEVVMAHITVQIGPCCTVPFSRGVPIRAKALGSWPPDEADLDGGLGYYFPSFAALPYRRPRHHRSCARLASSPQRI